ncbi:hypothetical protein O1611_g2116 [Lasiodiplodia mahajangana]|uniref:Uncharacterized protein n=1 Tax=Lasiodiplodia mahajangana TaxID=1108764 RepID=A0ACC2JW11_9PEZI|nr:hypothetical protein O1611_g2116 [Lasiodiplodia mahajangana]
MIANLGASEGSSPEDIVHHLRIATLLNSQVVMAGPQTNLEPGDFPHVVGEYNFLVVWRLCLPEWLFEWLKLSPFRHAAFRVRSSDYLFNLGREIVEEAEKGAGNDDVSASKTEISAEMAGQILAATETTSSALAFIFYYLAREPSLVEAMYEELQSVEGYNDLENLKLLNACITEGLRFRPPVALTGSRVVPRGGLDILGYYVPAGTVVTTQSALAQPAAARPIPQLRRVRPDALAGRRLQADYRAASLPCALRDGRPSLPRRQHGHLPDAHDPGGGRPRVPPVGRARDDAAVHGAVRGERVSLPAGRVPPCLHAAKSAAAAWAEGM